MGLGVMKEGKGGHDTQAFFSKYIVRFLAIAERHCLIITIVIASDLFRTD